MIKKFALIGENISYSLSPIIHKLFARQFNLHIDYKIIDVPEISLWESIQDFIAQGGSGINVTVPYKEIVFNNLKYLSPEATLAKSVNTLVINNNIITGYNTDGVGFIRDVYLRHKINLQQQILILGAGGAARGIIAEILKIQPNLSIANRDLLKAGKIADDFTKFGKFKIISYSEINNYKFDLIINATSCDMRAALNLNNIFYYDINYKYINTGLGMLVEQAAEAFYLWHGVRPITEPVIKYLLSIQTPVLVDL